MQFIWSMASIDIWALLVSIIVAPATSLLVVTIVAIATKALAITSVLAALMSLAGALMTTNASETTVLAACLATMESMLLLKMARVPSVSLLR